MLTELHINNFAIIDDLTIPFGPGLNVLTGETGAGKSIIVEALGLIAAGRASADVVRSGQDEAVVSARFDAGGLSEELVSCLEKAGYPVEDQLIIRRTVSGGGRSRASINNKPISIAELEKISPYILEISSQHEHQRLVNEATHLEIVGRFGGLSALTDDYSSKYSHYTGIRERLAEIERIAATAAEQREFLGYQLKEIDEAGLKGGEDVELDGERNRARHAAKLMEKIRAAHELLYSTDTSVTNAMGSVDQMLTSASEIDPSIKGWLSICGETMAAIKELSRSLDNYLEGLDADPARLEEIETRLYEIGRLKKKHGGSIEEIIKKRDCLAERLALIDSCDSEIAALQKDLAVAKGALKKSAERLSAAREGAAERLSGLIRKELDTLGLKKTAFIPGHLRLGIDDADETGIDRFGFLISPNPGEPVKPLARIASGGELSRVMLAIKKVLMHRVASATLEVFDEVDVGIGGAVAELVGEKLKQMAGKRQVICITHLPQVASFGDHHIVVSKRMKERRTVTNFEVLDGDGRVDEIARMLGGSSVTKTTREHAREMLERGYR